MSQTGRNRLLYESVIIHKSSDKTNIFIGYYFDMTISGVDDENFLSLFSEFGHMCYPKIWNSTKTRLTEIYSV